MTSHAGGRFRSRGRAEDRARSTNVRVDTGLGDPEKCGDLFRRETASHCAQDLTLTIGQRSGGSFDPAEHAAREHIAGEDPDQSRNGAMHPKM